MTVTLVAVLGPLLLSVTVKVIVSPTLGVALLTVLVTARSACCGVSVALALLLAVSGSNWSAWLMVAVLVCGVGAVHRGAGSAASAATPWSTVPTVQSPDAGL